MSNAAESLQLGSGLCRNFAIATFECEPSRRYGVCSRQCLEKLGNCCVLPTRGPCFKASESLNFDIFALDHARPFEKVL